MTIFPRKISILLPKKQSAFLWGARKTGKTTYLKSNFPDSAWFDLLDTDLFVAFNRQPSLLREQILALPATKLDKPIIIDEAQKVPLLFDEVHKLIEEKGISFILCGSSARKLKRGQANLLGGRAWRYEMLPLSYFEIKDFDLLLALQRGLIPSHYLSLDPKRSLQSYVNDYLKEEIREEGLTRNLPAFTRFLDAVGYSNGELINRANIARDCGVDSKTVKEYLNILVDTHIGFFLEPFKKRFSRQSISATPKFYLFDVGVAGQLAKRKVVALEGSEAGHAFEHFIICEIRAYRSYENLEFETYFWRTKTGLEVDLVVKSKDSLMPIEIKIKKRIDKTDLKGLKAFLDEFSLERGYLICHEKSPREIEFDDKKISILPWKGFLERLWTHSFL